LQRDLDEVALVESLESAGIHAHSLLKADSKMPDAPLLEEIDRARHQDEDSQSDKPTFAQENRIITRRQSRRIVAQIMTRHHLG
jgi:hypothetical protein